MNVQIAGETQLSGGVAESSKAFIRKQIELFKGNEIDCGDRCVVASFDGPARAIRCAAVVASIHGAYLRIGIHTGECDRVGDTYSGFAVDLADRIAKKAQAETILVSRTVKDLVAGSGIVFEENGTETFDGLEGEWRLFTVR
jgi:class 3 adenylate cyclase